MTRNPITTEHDEYRGLVARLAALVAEHPEAAPMLRDEASILVRGAQYPELVAETVTDDGDTFDAIRCPWCDELVSEDGSYDGLVVVDEGDRWTRVDPGEYDHKRHIISVDYDGGSEYEGLHYRHGSCGNPVGLPEGWSER